MTSSEAVQVPVDRVQARHDTKSVEGGALDTNNSTENTDPQDDLRFGDTPSLSKETSSISLRYARYRLLVGFLAAFSLAFILVALVGTVLTRLGLVTSNESSDEENGKDTVFTDAFAVGGPGVALHVADQPGLNPIDGSDFLLFSWIKLRRPILSDERVVFIAKYDPNSKIRPGYSIGLAGGTDGTRPIIYWQDESGKGQWHTFASTQIRAKEWYLMVVTFRKNRFLGVHLVPYRSPGRPELLGGYDLEGEEAPTNSAELVIGSFANGRFRGRLGPFGVIQKGDLTSTLDTLIEQLVKSPTSIPSSLRPSNVVLWSNGQRDIGPKALVIGAPPTSSVRDREPE